MIIVYPSDVIASGTPDIPSPQSCPPNARPTGPPLANHGPPTSSASASPATVIRASPTLVPPSDPASSAPIPPRLPPSPWHQAQPRQPPRDDIGRQPMAAARCRLCELPQQRRARRVQRPHALDECRTLGLVSRSSGLATGWQQPRWLASLAAGCGLVSRTCAHEISVESNFIRDSRRSLSSKN